MGSAEGSVTFNVKEDLGAKEEGGKREYSKALGLAVIGKDLAGGEASFETGEGIQKYELVRREAKEGANPAGAAFDLWLSGQDRGQRPAGRAFVTNDASRGALYFDERDTERKYRLFPRDEKGGRRFVVRQGAPNKAA